MTDLAKNEIKHARAIAGQIREGIHNYLATLSLIRRAYEERHWNVLGYESWQEYVDTEFGADRLRIPAEHRQKAVQELRLAGMSQRAIGSALGVSAATVNSDLSGVQDRTPDEITGTDGKTYAATQTPARRDPEPTQGESAVATTGGPVTASIPEPERVEQKPNRRPLPDAFRDGAYDLVKVVERLERLVLDDRFPRNAEQVARTCRHDLLRAVDLLAAVVDRIPNLTKESTE